VNYNVTRGDIMKRLLMIIVTLVMVVTLTACATNYTNISNSELETMLTENTDYLFIDVRTSKEYNDERVPGFDINIDYYKLDDDHSLISELDTDKTVVLMCNSGNRSVSAAKIFYDAGFTNIYNLKNGITGWNGETE